MTRVNMWETNSDLSKLAKMRETKQEEAIYIARNGTPIVQITLTKKPVSKRIGAAEGKFRIPDDFDEWDKEVEEMFGT